MDTLECYRCGGEEREDRVNWVDPDSAGGPVRPLCRFCYRSCQIIYQAPLSRQRQPGTAEREYEGI